MYAVIETGGFQISVQEGEKVKVPKLPDHPKEKVSFDKILLVGGERSLIGTPYVRDAKVEAEVLATGKGEKVVVFKKKRGQNTAETKAIVRNIQRLRSTKFFWQNNDQGRIMMAG